MRKRLIGRLGLIGLCLGLVSCDENTTNTYYSIDINSSPSTAEVYFDEKYIGDTPVGWGGKKKPNSLTIKKSGYKTKKIMIEEVDFTVKYVAPPYRWPEGLEEQYKKEDKDKRSYYESLLYETLETSIFVILEKEDEQPKQFP